MSRAWLVWAVLLITCLPLRAQTTVYWDTNGSTSGASSGSTAAGTWDQGTTSSWTTSSGGTASTDDWATKVTSGTGGNARFAAGTNATGSYTVTVSGDVGNNSNGYLYNITIDEGTLTFGGSGTLYIRAGGITNNTSNALTFDANLNLVANQTWNIGSAALTANGAVSLGASNRTLNITGAGGATISGVISESSGNRRLTKGGTGTLTLTGANTYTGGTTINAGTLSTNSLANGGSASGIGDSTNAANRLIINGGTLKYTGAATSTNRRFTLGTSGGTIDASGTGALNFTNTAAVTLSGTNTARTFTLTGTNTDANTLAAVIGDNGSGATSLTKTGAGKWVLTGANTYTGATTVSAGTLVAQHADALGTSASGTSVSAGATLELQNNITIAAEALTVTGTGRLLNTVDSNAYGGVISGTGGVEVTGGVLTLSGNNSYSGANTISGTGGLVAASNNAFGTGGGTTTVTGNAGVGMQNNVTITSETNLSLSGGGYQDLGSLVNVSDSNQWEGDITLGSDVAFHTMAGSMTVGETSTYADDISIGAYNLTLKGVTGSTMQIASEITGTGGVIKTGANQVFLSNANSYTGTTTISEGTLTYSVNNALSDSTAVTVASGATFDVNGKTDTVGSLAGAGNVTLGSGALTAGGDNTSTSYSGVMSGTGTFTKAGTGTLTLSGTNTYSGATTVSAGTLQANSNGALGANTGDVTVSSGATLALNGGLTIDKSGSGADLNLAGTGVSSAGALAAVGSTGSTTQYNGNITLTADATIKTADNLLILGDNNTFANTITLGSHTLTLDTTSATGVVPTYGPFPAYDLDTSNLYITGTVTGTGGLTKTGAGTVNLISFPAVGQAYTGDTTVTGGKLIVDGQGQVDGYNDPTINSTNVYIGNSSSPGAADSVVIQMGQYGEPAAPNYLIGHYDIGTNTATTNMTIYEDGLFDLNGGSNRLKSLNLTGGHVTGRDLTAYNALLTITDGVTTSASTQTAVIEELNLGMSANGFTFNIADGAATDDLRIDGIVQNGIGFTGTSYDESLVKTGAGTLAFTNANSYQGVTDIQQGIVRASHNQALGMHGGVYASIANGTTVASGAQLQLDGSGGDLTIGIETLSLNGTGVGGNGALYNTAGDNTYKGFVILESNTRINAASGSSLFIGNPLDGSQTTLNGNSSGRDLTIGGAGDITIHGQTANFVDELIKDGTGSLTLSGSVANSFTGGLNVKDGTVNLSKTAGVNAVGTSTNVTVGDSTGAASSANLVYQASNQMPDTVDLVLNSDGRVAMGTYTDAISSVTGTGLIDLGTSGVLTVAGDNSSFTFDGTVTGSGTLVKAGTGTLTLTNDISYTGTLEIGGGTLVLSGMDLTVTNLIITADTILDFSGMDSHIFTTNFSFLSDDITLNIINWTKNADGFFATNWSGATPDLTNNGGAKPMAQILFNGLNPNGDPWTWNDTGWDSYNDEIYPWVPEPSTYGALLTAATLALLAYRKRQRVKTTEKS